MEGQKKSNMLLKEVAYNQIKEKILEEEFEPGQFLSERKIIELLQMSKTPIKSALDRLETEGFLTVSSKQGIMVNDLTVEQIIDIYNLRTALETFICEQIFDRITDEQLALLRNNLKETNEVVKELDVKGFAKKDHEFHLLLCKISGNQEIYRILLNYNAQLLRITLRHLKRYPERMERFIEEHEEIYRQLEKKSDKCIDLMKQHLQESKKMLFS